MPTHAPPPTPPPLETSPGSFGKALVAEYVDEWGKDEWTRDGEVGGALGVENGADIPHVETSAVEVGGAVLPGAVVTGAHDAGVAAGAHVLDTQGIVSNTQGSVSNTQGGVPDTPGGVPGELGVGVGGNASYAGGSASATAAVQRPDVESAQKPDVASVQTPAVASGPNVARPVESQRRDAKRRPTLASTAVVEETAPVLPQAHDLKVPATVQENLASYQVRP